MCWVFWNWDLSKLSYSFNFVIDLTSYVTKVRICEVFPHFWLTFRLSKIVELLTTKLLNGDGLNSILSNIEQTRTSFFNHRWTGTCSSFGDRTWTPNFWFLTNGHLTSNLIEPSLDLLNCLTNRLEHRFFKHQTNSNMFIFR